MALAKINGRSYFLDTDKFEIEEVSNGRWKVTYDRGDFIVVGGTSSGGAANEWFCYYPEMYGDTWLSAKSMIAAIRRGVVY